MRCGACEWHRGKSRRGKQHEAKLSHDDEIPGRFLIEGVAINRYALGRIVAGEEDATRFISSNDSMQNTNVHCAFTCTMQSPHMRQK
jgi:hypothetical protein